MINNVYELIRDIEKDKKERRIFPAHAMYRELLNKSELPIEDINSVLNKLFKAGFILVGETINDKYITTDTINEKE